MTPDPLDGAPDMQSVRERLYATVRKIRRFEEEIVGLVNSNEIPGVTHEYIGEEAIAAGVCAALVEADVLTSTHRGHGHLIARGVPVKAMVAELLAREAGTNRGRGGSMHVADLSRGILGANGIVAAGAPIATGAAWAALRKGTGGVAVCFFGDGGINQGVLAESMNLASLWKLPVLFVCENNGYAVSLSVAGSTAGSIVARARALGMAAESVDGMDAEVVLRATSEQLAAVRAGAGPAFLECRAYRFTGHNSAEGMMGLPTYRQDAEIAAWRERDPVEVIGTRLEPARRAELDAEIERELVDAIAYARAQPFPDVGTALDYVYADLPRPRTGYAL
jgi:acetoin:2,6-dichlorophenolindophenol oxidoreductase subunit alpha